LSHVHVLLVMVISRVAGDADSQLLYYTDGHRHIPAVWQGWNIIRVHARSVRKCEMSSTMAPSENSLYPIHSPPLDYV